MPTKKKVTRRAKAPQKRDMKAFCRKLQKDMSGKPLLNQFDLWKARVDELSPEELTEYFRLASIGSDRNWYVGLAS